MFYRVRSTRLVAALVFSATATAAIAQPAPPPAVRHRVAVLDFGYASVMTASQAVFGTNVNIAKASPICCRQAHQRRPVPHNRAQRHLEGAHRAELRQLRPRRSIVRREDRQDPRCGRHHHRRHHHLRRDDNSKNLGGIAGGTAGILLGHVGKSSSKAVVAVTARMIDANTGEVLASVTSRGESSVRAPASSAAERVRAEALPAE